MEELGTRQYGRVTQIDAWKGRKGSWEIMKEESDDGGTRL